MAYDSQNKIKAAAQKDLLWRREEYFHVNDHLNSHFKASFSDQKRVTLYFHAPIALSSSRAERTLKLWGPEIGEWHSKKDLDNYIKYILDIGNQILWHDDSQIVELHAYQQYSENPCTIIEIEDIKIFMNDETEKMMKIFSPAAIDQLACDLAVLQCELESFALRTNENRGEMQASAAKSLKYFAEKYCESLRKLIAKDNKSNLINKAIK